MIRVVHEGTTEDHESQEHSDETASCGASWNHCESRLLLLERSHADRWLVVRMHELGSCRPVLRRFSRCLGWSRTEIEVLVVGMREYRIYHLYPKPATRG
jgi:hypothetical protein